ncbi:MAG: hypothetical protein K1X36_00585 [Pyrinomonadaceae bacterium]|nr:hypothetical protein [Pyrinomonadaceae bacterium]
MTNESLKIDPSLEERIVGDLQILKKRTNLFLQPVTPENLQTYFNGLTRGLMLAFPILDFDKYVDVYRKVRRDHGFEDTARAVFKEMREKDLSEESIVGTMIEIEMEVWKLVICYSD